jgi:hypothetical protein
LEQESKKSKDNYISILKQIYSKITLSKLLGSAFQSNVQDPYMDQRKQEDILEKQNEIYLNNLNEYQKRS